MRVSNKYQKKNQTIQNIYQLKSTGILRKILEIWSFFAVTQEMSEKNILQHHLMLACKSCNQYNIRLYFYCYGFNYSL